MDKLIIFDWGGVIECHHGKGRTADESWIAVMRRLGAADSDRSIFKNIYLTGYAFDIHKICDPFVFEEFAAQLCASSGISFPGLQEFFSAYDAEFNKTDYYPYIIELIQSLRGQCQIGLLSNILLPDKKRIESRIPFSAFNYMWLSTDFGMTKPELLALAENNSGISPQNILLVDNNPAYTSAGFSRGWNVHLVRESRINEIPTAVVNFLQK